MEKSINKYKLKQHIFFTSSSQETQKAASLFAEKLLRTKERNKAIVIGLQGELGSGKTTFVQGFAKGLGITEKVLSPTFVIIKSYKIPDTRHKVRNFYHIDCYRIAKPKEILELGWKHMVADPANIIVVEWSERIKSILPKGSIIIDFQTRDKNKRKLHFVRGYGKI